MYLISGWYATSQYDCCWTYVSSLTIPDSSTAKSPACEDGKRSATKSSKLPVKPRSPGQFGHVGIARGTLVWNRRTGERSLGSRSTLTRKAPVLRFSGSLDEVL